MKRTSQWAAVLVLVFAAAACGSDSPRDREQLEPTVASDPVERLAPTPISDFTLTDQDGSPFRLSDRAGTVRLFYFGYTSCPDICPTTMVDWRDTARLLGEDAKKVTFIMVTVDPEVDKPPVLKRFLGLFDSSFIGLSGSPDELKSVWDAFDVTVETLDLPESATGHSISHSAAVHVIDQEGDLVMKFRFDAEPEDMAEGVQQLLEGT